ncbi:MAG: hypothetical protein ACFFCH_08175 [Promethearchaeota archaeon]
MGLYRFLLGRLARGVVMLFGFSLLCFAIFSSIPPWPSLICIDPIDPLWGLWSIGEVNPWDFAHYSWIHFWKYGRTETVVTEIGRFVFYLMHMFQGDFGFSFRTGQPYSEFLIHSMLPSIILIIPAFAIALWIRVFWQYWKRWYFFYRTESRIGLVSARLLFGILFWVASGLFLLYLITITCPIIFGSIIFGNRLELPWDEFNPLNPRYFAIPVFLIAWSMILGWKLSKRIQDNSDDSLSAEATHFSDGVKQPILSAGIRAGFLCSFVLSATFFIEVFCRYYGIGRLFCASLYFADYPELNMIFFLIGISVIVISFSAEVIYGLVRFGPFRFRRLWSWKHVI